VGVQEIEGAAAAASGVGASSLDAVDQGPADGLHALGADMGQGPEELVPGLQLHGDLLDYPHRQAFGGWIQPLGGGAEDNVVVFVVEPQEGRFAPVGPLGSVGDVATQDLGVELEGAVHVGHQETHVPDAFDIDSHDVFPPATVPD